MYTWTKFTEYLTGDRYILAEERDELWDALAERLSTCGGKYQLNAADMTAIKGSFILTDLTSIESVDDPDDYMDGDLALVLISYKDAFTGVTGLDAFKAVAPAEGLSDDQLAEFITSAGRITDVDAYHTWNLYRRVLIYLQCCPTTAPGIVSKRRGASLSKWGYSHNGVNFYWEMTGSGSESVDEPTDPPNTLTSSMTASGGVDVATQTRLISLSRDHSSGTGGTGSTTWPTCDWHNYWYGVTGSTFSFLASFAILAGYEPGVCEPTSTGFALSGLPSSHGVTYVTPAKIVYESFDGAGDYEVNFSDEYTDADLEADVIAAMGSYVSGGGAGSYRNKATDGTSLTLDQEKQAFNLSGFGALSVGVTYRIPYLIRFTPLGGGSPVDGDETYLEFTYTSGMTETVEIEIPIPDENGTNSLVVLGFQCAPFDDEDEE